MIVRILWLAVALAILVAGPIACSSEKTESKRSDPPPAVKGKESQEGERKTLPAQ